MIGQTLKIHTAVVESSQHLGLARAGHASDQHKIQTGRRLLQGVEEKIAQRLVTAGHSRIVDTCFAFQPLLNDLRAQAAAKTVDIALRVVTGEISPGLNSLVFERPAYQPVA